MISRLPRYKDDKLDLYISAVLRKCSANREKRSAKRSAIK